MPSILQDLMQELSQLRAGTRAVPSTTPSTPYMFGPNGLFGVSGLERDVISTRVQPVGLLSALPARPSNTAFPLFPYITGFRDDTGSEASGVCDDPPTAGAMKTCLQTAAYGRYSRQTRNMDIDRVGLVTNRGEFQDLRLINDPLLQGLGGAGIDVPSSIPANPDLAREVLIRWVEVGVALQNLISRQVYIGNPANNTANDGYKEFPGLDILIGTNKRDAQTGATCPSLNSDIKDFNYVKVTAAGGDTIVNVVTYLMRMLKHIAERTGLAPATWALTMRQALFWELTAVWPCSYLTYRCLPSTVNTQTQLVVDSNDQIRMRDEMRAGSYLLVDGERYPVIIDSAIVEESSGDTNRVDATCFASDIYVVPLTAIGMPVTYVEYFNYNQGPMQAISDGRLGSYFWTDDGKFLWHAKPPTNYCVQWLTKVEPRLVLRTPQIAGVVRNVQYCPLQHERDFHPDDDYFVDGGVTTRTTTEPYSEWNLP